MGTFVVLVNSDSGDVMQENYKSKKLLGLTSEADVLGPQFRPKIGSQVETPKAEHALVTKGRKAYRVSASKPCMGPNTSKQNQKENRGRR